VSYLSNEGFLLKDGTPVGLTGAATHIYWTEPYNLILCRLIQSGTGHDVFCCSLVEGILEKICSGPNRKSNLLLTLCHLFCRQPIPPSYREVMEDVCIFSPAPGIYLS
jgi:hypothetical protein